MLQLTKSVLVFTAPFKLLPQEISQAHWQALISSRKYPSRKLKKERCAVIISVLDSQDRGRRDTNTCTAAIRCSNAVINTIKALQSTIQSTFLANRVLKPKCTGFCLVTHVIPAASMLKGTDHLLSSLHNPVRWAQIIKYP